MFYLIKRKFYTTFIVVAIVIVTVFFSAYLIVANAIQNDYTHRITDISSKIGDELNAKTDYVQYVSSYFVANLLAENADDSNMSNYDFKTDINKIRIYNNTINGLALYWEDGQFSLSKSAYLQYLSDIWEIMKKEDREFWFIAEATDIQRELLFFALPVEDSRTGKRGLALIDATPLKSNIAKENMFVKNDMFVSDVSIFFSSFGEKMYLINPKKRIEHTVVFHQKIKENLDVIMEFSMQKMERLLFRIKIYMVFLAGTFIVISFFIIRRVLKKVISDLNTLKTKIDLYALKNDKK